MEEHPHLSLISRRLSGKREAKWNERIVDSRLQVLHHVDCLSSPRRPCSIESSKAVMCHQRREVVQYG